MSIGRVTHSSMISNADRNIQNANQRLAAALDKSSSMKKVSRASDNPADAAAAMNVRGQQRANVQFSRNVDDAQSWLSVADTSLASASDLLHRARTLITNGANSGAQGPDSREAIALEVDSLREALLDTANTTYMGRHVFAGTSDQEHAFTADGQWQGVEGSSVERKVGPNSTVRVDADGQRAFGSGDDSIFSLLERVSADLRANNPISEHINELGDRHGQLLAVQATVGASHSSVLRAQESLGMDKVNLEARRSGLEDADLAEVALELQSSEIAYQASLMVTSRALQTSLMDYLR